MFFAKEIVQVNLPPYLGLLFKERICFLLEANSFLRVIPSKFHLSIVPGRLFHCYMLDKSICHIGVVGSIWSFLFCF